MADNRPKEIDGKLHKGCTTCGIEPDRCKGDCIFQQLAEQSERERKEHGNRIQRHGRIK